MSLTREHRQEALSFAYISAVAAKAGYNCGPFPGYDYGVDLQISCLEQIGVKKCLGDPFYGFKRKLPTNLQFLLMITILFMILKLIHIICSSGRIKTPLPYLFYIVCQVMRINGYPFMKTVQHCDIVVIGSP